MLPFHVAKLAPKRTRIMLNVASFCVIPATIWAFFFVRKKEHERKEREKIEGPPYYRRIPRYHKPLPWGDGETPFFAAMCQYWGIEPNDYYKRYK